MGFRRAPVCLAGGAGVHDVRVVFVVMGVLLGCLPFTAELEEAW